MKTLTLITLGLLFGIMPVFSQSGGNDLPSIRNQIENAKQLIYKDPGNAFEEAEIAFKKASDTNNDPEIARSAEILGIIESQRANYDTSFVYLNKALSIWTKLDDKPGMVRMYTELATLKDREDEYGKAFEFLTQAMEVPGMEESIEKGYLYKAMGNVIRSSEDSEDPEIYFQKALEIFDKNNDQLGLAITNYNLANYYYHQNNLKSAADLLENKVIPYFFLREYYYNLSMAYNVLGLINGDLKEYKQARENFNLSIEYAKLIDDSLLISDVYTNISLLIYNEEGDVDKALAYADTASLFLGDKGGKYDELYLADHYAYLYSKKEDFASAFQQQQKVNRLSQEIYDDEVQEKKQALQEVEKELGIQTLKNKLQNQKHLRNGLIAGLIFMLAMIIYSIYYFRQKRKAQVLFLQKNALLHSMEIDELISNQVVESSKARITGGHEERARIAETLHDRIGSYLAAIGWRLDADNSDNLSTTVNDAPGTNTTLEMVRKTTKELKMLVEELKPNDFSWVEDIERFCTFISEGKKLQTEFCTYGTGDPLDKKIGEEMYDITLQLIANVLEHAEASEMSVQINHMAGEELNIMVEDNGKGFIFNQPIRNHFGIGGNGLKNLKTRVKALDGIINVDSKPGKGTIVNIVIPL